MTCGGFGVYSSSPYFPLSWIPPSGGYRNLFIHLSSHQVWKWPGDPGIEGTVKSPPSCHLSLDGYSVPLIGFSAFLLCPPWICSPVLRPAPGWTPGPSALAPRGSQVLRPSPPQPCAAACGSRTEGTHAPPPRVRRRFFLTHVQAAFSSVRSHFAGNTSDPTQDCVPECFCASAC